MKKLLILFAFLSVAVLMAGCIETSTSCDGYVYNQLDEKVKVQIKNKGTGAIDSFTVRNESSIKRGYNPGTYSVSAWYYSSDEFIDSTDFRIESTDEHFTITINTTVYANAY